MHAVPDGWRVDAIAITLAVASIWAGTWTRRHGLDTDLFLTVNGWRGLPDVAWEALSAIGLGLSAFVLTSFATRRHPAVMGALAWLLVIGGALTQVTKRLLEMPRPASVLDPSMLHVIGRPLRHNSMPSGHTLTAVAVLFILWAVGGASWRRPAIAAALACVTIGVALSRIATGAHWPSDVAAGVVVGWAAARLAVRLSRMTRSERLFAGPAADWIVGAAQVGCGAALAATPVAHLETRIALSAVGTISLLVGLSRIAGRVRAGARSTAPPEPLARRAPYEVRT